MTLPPGPSTPRAAQTYEWVARPTTLLRRSLARYGDPFTLRTHWTDAPLVLVSDPDEIKRIFAADPAVLHSGESSAILEPFAGRHSILVLDGAEHMRQRKLLLPPFHGESTSLETCYPAKHQKLAQGILQNDGAIVSEYPFGTPALAENFPRRNRIISGMSVGTLVVEATLRSGSLITARCAMEQGREVFAIPGSIHNPLARGCHALIQQGAKLVGTVEDILEELQPLIEFVATQATPITLNKLDEQQQKLLNCLGFEPTPMDVIIERSGLNAQNTAAELLTLELQGYITTTTRGYQRVKI